MGGARLIAGLTRLTRDVGVAEDLAQDALVAALEQWPASGVPANPGAWLMAIAKRRAIDRFRREELGERKRDEFGRAELARNEATMSFDASLDDDIGDDLLRLVFIACHPVLSRPARVSTHSAVWSESRPSITISTFARSGSPPSSFGTTA